MNRAASIAAFASLVLVAAVAQGADRVDACADKAENSEKLQRSGAFKQARDALAACSRPECPAVIRNDCARRLAQVERALASVMFRAQDSSGVPVTDVRVLVDGHEVASSLDGEPIELDPGTHTVRYVTADGTTVEDSLVLAREEKRRLFLMRLPAPKVAPVPVATPSGPLAETPPSTEVPPDVPATLPPASGAGVPGGAYALAGIGLAFLGVGAAFWALGTKEHDDLAKSCALTHTCTSQQVASSRDKLIAGDIVAGSGVICTVSGVVWAIRSQVSSDAPQAAKPSARGILFVTGSF